MYCSVLDSVVFF